MGIVFALVHVVLDVAQFWKEKLRHWWSRKVPVELWLDILRHAEAYEDWEEAALHLDNLLGLDLWRNNATSKYFDYHLIHERLESLATARDDHSYHRLVNLLRSGLVRNLGNITAPKLYNRSYAGTKYLIEEYITQVASSIETIAALPTMATATTATTSSHGYHLAPPSRVDGYHGNGNGDQGSHQDAPIKYNNSTDADADTGHVDIDVNVDDGYFKPRPGPAMTTQAKLDFIHDTRQAFGRSTLVLQGGAIFGLCHLGVAKALFLRGLLPRIITGTATGALIAALVAIHTEEELPAVFSGDGIDLSAFAVKVDSVASENATRWETLMRRLSRFAREGYLLDVRVLEECVRANVGDLTFEEAYNRSKRVLNITVATDGQGGIPTLLNYLTAPNVLIWTAAIASNASPSLYGHRETTVLCRDSRGNIVPWAPTSTVFRHWTHTSYSDRDSPLTRIAELYNVNHFIISQARPYLIPFLQSDMHGPSSSFFPSVGNRTTTPGQATAFLLRMVGLELRHRLRQLDTLGVLPASIRRFLVDELVPASTASVTLVPGVTTGDFVRLLETPTRDKINYWILKGERSVWPAVAALQIRCAIENELDRAYQVARRLRAGGLRRKASVAAALAAPGMARRLTDT